MTALHNQTPQKEKSILIKLIKLLGIFLCCFILSMVLSYIICEIAVMLGVSVKFIRSFEKNFINFGVMICTPLCYLWFVDKKLGSKIESNFSFCLTSFLITILLVIFRHIHFYLISDNRLHFLPTALKQWVFPQEGDLFTKSLKALNHLNSLSDVLWEGILPFIIIAGIGEELIFRAILQNIFLQKTKKQWMAIVMASILFAIAHGTIYYSIKIFLMGLLLGIIYHITNNIYLVIFAHMFNNGIIVLLMYFLQGSPLTNPISIATQKLSIWQVTLGITICMFCILFLIKKLKVIQHNTDVPST